VELQAVSEKKNAAKVGSGSGEMRVANGFSRGMMGGMVGDSKMSTKKLDGRSRASNSTHMLWSEAEST